MSKLSISNRFLKGGDVITVRWDSKGNDSQQLKISTGSKTSFLTVPATGEKKLKMKGGNLFNSISLITERNGKKRTKSCSFLVFGKEKYDSFEYVSPSSDKGIIGKMKGFWERTKKTWRAYPQEKRRLYNIAMMIFAYQMLLPHYPQLSMTLSMLTMFYIFYLCYKN